MYEQVSHALLNEILGQLKVDDGRDPCILRHFYTRLGANFYSIHSLFERLYGEREDFKAQLCHLVEIMRRRYLERSERLRESDLVRERDFNWFLSEKWVGMALYCDRFAGDIEGLRRNIPYLQELGINLLHIMPMLDCPPDHSDGGYAVSNFLEVAPRFGSNQDVERLGETLRARDMLLVLDVVVNHTSDEHEWAVKARQGNQTFQDYYYVFEDRALPDIYEETLPEIFPETSPGNFTWDEAMGKWVMTIFNHYQWDLNYHNPRVLIEMVDIILFWANRGADILRLDAVAFLWKKLGSVCQNEREAHWLLQLMKDCCQVTAPGVLFIAEAIVAPGEIAKYFGEDAINAKECEIAYNATLMALLWDAVATRNAKLLRQGIESLPVKLERATWLNYVRCHDDIVLGYDDNDIRQCGYDPTVHRRFLIEYFTGRYPGSLSRGLPFGGNAKTGDTRISGSLASLVGLEVAVEQGDPDGIDTAIRWIILLHGVILSFGGIPLLYYGDAVGMTNSPEYLDDPYKRADNRWVHRYHFDWAKAERRHETGTIENRIFGALKRMIIQRKEIRPFADIDNRRLLALENINLLAYLRTDPINNRQNVLVIANFNDHVQTVSLDELQCLGAFDHECMTDQLSGIKFKADDGILSIAPIGLYWLAA